MEVLENLINWAEAKGVVLNGLRPERIPGRGTGVIATRAVKAKETVLTVPTAVLRSLHTVPGAVSRPLPRDITLHGVLAADLALDESGTYDVWNAALPSRAEFEAGVPIMWPEELQALLPERAADLLKKQQAKFQRDWDMVTKAFPKVTRDLYLYSWLLVNTRTFYYTTPELDKRPREDRMALQPVADLLNHANQGCAVAFSADGFAITAKRDYQAGEEIHISYGSHSNDFLLVEYGFVLDENRWDEACLDSVILPRLTKIQKAELDEVGFLGRYMLDAETAGCHRTQVALRLLCCTPGQWNYFVINAEDNGPGPQPRVDALLKQILQRYLDSIAGYLDQLNRMGSTGRESQRDLLETRWRQLKTMVTETIQRLGD